MPILSVWKRNTLEGATSIIAYDTGLCAKKVVLYSGVQKIQRVILAKIGTSYSPKKRLQYIIDANKLILAKADDYCTIEVVCK